MFVCFIRYDATNETEGAVERWDHGRPPQSTTKFGALSGANM